jgi:hypothetical protein
MQFYANEVAGGRSNVYYAGLEEPGEVSGKSVKSESPNYGANKVDPAHDSKMVNVDYLGSIYSKRATKSVYSNFIEPAHYNLLFRTNFIGP